MRYNNPRRSSVIIGCLALIFILILFAVMGGVIFTLLWNLVIPTAFGGPTLSFVQGTALMLVIGMIGSAFRAVITTTTK